MNRVEYIIQNKNGMRPFLNFDGSKPEYLENAKEFAKECDRDIPNLAPHIIIKRTITESFVETILNDD